MLQGLEFGAGFPGAFPMQPSSFGNPLAASGPSPADSMTIVDEFSTEDNNLLMSVLNSTPLEHQYSFYVPPAGGSVAVPPPWPDLATPAVAPYADVPATVSDYNNPYGAFGMPGGGFPPMPGPQTRHLPNPTMGYQQHPNNVPIKPDPALSQQQMPFNPMPFPPPSMSQQTQSRPNMANQPAPSHSLSSPYNSPVPPQVVVSSPTDFSHESAATSASAGS